MVHVGFSYINAFIDSVMPIVYQLNNCLRNLASSLLKSC